MGHCRGCGSAIPFLAGECDVCRTRGIPQAPPVEVWRRPEEVPPVQFVSWATWTTRRAPHSVLAPAILRLQVAMGATLIGALGNLILSALPQPGWWRAGLVVAGLANLGLLFGLRRQSVAAWVGALALAVLMGLGELVHPTFGYTLAAFRAVLAAGVAQGYTAVVRLRRATRANHQEQRGGV